jgi:hypothetical protein
MYLKAVADVAALFGRLIPDLDFVLHAKDMPTAPPADKLPHEYPPVLRYCRTPATIDIVIMNQHCYM